MTDIPEVVERVARAIGEELRAQELSGEADLSPEESDRLLAQAALGALEQPTPEMVEAGIGAIADWSTAHDPAEWIVGAVYRAMIQAALGKEGR